MSKFNTQMSDAIAALVGSSTTHKETGTITFTVPENFYPEGITPETLSQHVDFINSSSVAVEAAVSQLAAESYPDSKKTHWDGELQLTENVKLSAGIQLQEKLEDQDPMFGITECFVDYHYNDDLTNWYADFAETNKARAAALFAEE